MAPNETKAREKEVFDRSFDLLNVNNTADRQASDSIVPTDSIFWSLNDVDKNANHVTMDDSNIFALTATEATFSMTHSPLFDSDPFACKSRDGSLPEPTFGPSIVSIAVHEQLSTLYDAACPEPTTFIQGTIYLKPPTGINAPFCFTLRDSLGHVNNLQLQSNTEEVMEPKGENKQLLHRQDRLFKVTLSPSEMKEDEVLVARYSCVPHLKPVPLLVKSRVNTSDKACRAGFKLRSNPSNSTTLTDVVILLAVPPHLSGEHVKMSRTGGIWDEMKRTISWVIGKVEPGEALELQVHFEAYDRPQEAEGTVRFPLLVRAECKNLFSKVEVLSDFCESKCSPVTAQVKYSSRVLHRKV